MEIGIFSRTFQEKTLQQVLQRMTQHGIHHTQFNLACAQMDTMPLRIASEKIEEIRGLCQKYEVHLEAISGTFNMVAPDKEEREDGCKRFEIVCQVAQELEIPVVTLCTGSRCPENKWKWHNDNDSQEAWEDLLRTTERVLKSAVRYDCTLGVEIETSNVIHSAVLARKYFDTFKSEHLKIIMDGANLFTAGQLIHQKNILKEAFELVGRDIVLAHAKDVACEDGITFTAAGEGILDYKSYLTHLKECGYTGTLMMHGLEESQVTRSIHFLKEQLRELF
jgi:sugar phosphate isomerase/epimerase